MEYWFKVLSTVCCLIGINYGVAMINIPRLQKAVPSTSHRLYVFFLSKYDFFSFELWTFVTTWVVNLCHQLSFVIIWVFDFFLPQFESLSFVTSSVFEGFHNFPFLRVVTIIISEFCSNLILYLSFFPGQSGGASQWKDCYQQSIPRLV